MTITRHTACALVVDTLANNEQWCIFEHLAVMTEGEPPQVIFIGVCKLVEVYKMAPARTNSEWFRIFEKGGQVLVQIIGTTTDKTEAFRFAQERIRETMPRPICNVNGRNLKSQRASIQCVQNGRYYNSQLEAAHDLGIYASSISRQLSGQSPSAQGFTFIYAERPIGDIA